MKRFVIALCLSVVLSLIVVVPDFTVYAQSVVVKTPVTQGPVQQINKYFSTQTKTYSDGAVLSRDIINGPAKPPSGFEFERSTVALPESDKAMGIKTLTVPAFNWVFGCSSVSGAMIAGYYDRNGFPNMYTGPTNGGVMPLNNSSWPTWSDGVETYPNLPLAGSHNGVDGRVTKGSIDDYWIQYGSSAADPYITGSWTQHTWSDAIGDYMKTSQSAYGNTDGSTNFWTYTSSANQLACSDMPGYSITNDGTEGRKLFYEARGYTVTDCYNQKTDNKIAGGFSFAQFKAEIDAGRPVMLNLNGHTIVGIGYNDSVATDNVYVHDTWDYSNHTMTWGGSYTGMELLSVSIVNLQAPAPASYLYASFTGSGLYKWNGAAWSRIHTTIPASMTASSTDLYATFTGYGIYKYNGTAWSRIHTTIPASMKASSTVLYATFTGSGLYKYNGTAWSRIHTTIPASMKASGADLYATFTGSGLYKWNGIAWSRIHTTIPANMTASRTALYATFTGSGLYKWNGSAWGRIHTTIPASMTASSADLYATFTGSGLYKWNGSVWSRIHATIPASITASSTDLYANFTSYGLYQYKGAAWSRIHTTIPAAMAGSR